MTKTTLCMNPGPIEFEDDVLQAMSHEGISHTDPAFLHVFGDCLDMLREVALASDSTQPVIVSGSGTLGWDMTAANFTSKGDKVLVINTGYFGDAFGDCLSTYGAVVTHLNAAHVGDVPSVESLKDALQKEKYKLITMTHVDTSTGVLQDLQTMAKTVRIYQPEALIVVDSVCAFGGSELRMSDWDLDIVLTGSQKCLGVPAGLSLWLISARALQRLEGPMKMNSSYYVSLTKWLPIMRKYQAREPSYFATPAVNHFYALHVALKRLLENGGMEARFAEHALVSQAMKEAISALGCSFIPKSEDIAATTMTCVRYPTGVQGSAFLKAVTSRGISLSGGLHKDIKSEYFRIGHMGPSSRRFDHVYKTIVAIQEALLECGHVLPEEQGASATAIMMTLKEKAPHLKNRNGPSFCHSWSVMEKWNQCPVPYACQLKSVGLVATSIVLGYALARHRG